MNVSSIIMTLNISSVIIILIPVILYVVENIITDVKKTIHLKKK